jgi:HTH-type transcriptional regulator/antitoxin HigA
MNFLRLGDMSLCGIKTFAKAVKVPPYIVIGRLQKERFVPYNQFSSEKLRSSCLDILPRLIG